MFAERPAGQQRPGFFTFTGQAATRALTKPAKKVPGYTFGNSSGAKVVRWAGKIRWF
jgi:hypothetical protein